MKWNVKGFFGDVKSFGVINFLVIKNSLLNVETGLYTYNKWNMVILQIIKTYYLSFK